MTNLHASLLAEIDSFDRLLVHKVRFNVALRVVVERHKPQPDAYCGATCSVCFNGLGERPTYPCADIQAIARELGVEG